MIIISPSFQESELIPQKFSCKGDPASAGINPELEIENVPEGAKALVLIMDDPDATRGRTFTHWLVWNIDPSTTIIKEESTPLGSIEGVNDAGKIGYLGPCPPPGSAPHRYFFKLYALDTKLDLKSGTTKAELESAMTGHVIAGSALIGRFGR